MRKQFQLDLLAGGMFLAMSIACAGQQPSSTLQDAALHRVTMRLKSAALKDALQELSRLTAVHLSTSADTADLKVTILVKDLPLGIVQARLAETLHLTWITHEATKAQPPSYLIYRSKLNEDEELELSARGERAFRKGIDDAISVLTLAPEERAKLFSKRKALAANFSEPGGEAAAMLLAQISPATRTSIMDGNKLEFPASIPPTELAPHFAQIRKQFKAATTDSRFDTLFDQEGKYSITRTGEGAGSQIAIAASIDADTLTATLGYHIKGVDAREVYPEAFSPDHTGTDYADVRLPVAIPTTLTAKSLDDLLERVADSLHINIIGESYWKYIPKHGKSEAVYPYSVPEGPSSIEKALDGIKWQDSWWKQGSVYLFQRPLWWVDRRADVTDPSQAYLTKILQRQPLSFDDATEVCKTLSADQWGWLMPRYNGASLYLTPMQSVLRFYGSLTASRKTDLFREGGTEASTLEAADQLRLHVWIAETGKKTLLRLQNTPGKIRVTAAREALNAKQGPVHFRAMFQTKDGKMTLLREQLVVESDPNQQQTSSED